MKKLLISATFAVLLTACASAPRLAPPTALTAPTPIMGNSGKYMSPYTEDGTVALWVEKGRAASAGANVGGFVGAQAGAKLAENIPFIGGMLGQKVGETMGRTVALKMVGGEEFIKQNSDMSFDNVRDLALYMYVKNSSHKDYPQVLDLAQKIYPELQKEYMPAIMSASAAKR
jgi:hypothetical protein